MALAVGHHSAHDFEGALFGPDHHPERAALAGKPLVHGPDGKRLLGAWCEFRADWQFLREAINCKHHYGPGARICHLCPAERGVPGAATDWTNFSLDGPLRGMLVGPRPGPEGWESHEVVSPLCGLPGFSVWRCMFDLMHTLDLGLLQRVIPAALQTLMGDRAKGQKLPKEDSLWPGRSREKRCQAATEDHLAWAKRTRSGESYKVKKGIQKNVGRGPVA